MQGTLHYILTFLNKDMGASIPLINAGLHLYKMQTFVQVTRVTSSTRGSDQNLDLVYSSQVWRPTVVLVATHLEVSSLSAAVYFAGPEQSNASKTSRDNFV